MVTQTRSERIDFLRFLGLAMIILAHVDPPNILFQLRNFDVPLMVLISGASFGLSFKNEPYGAYLWKRIKRLVFPVWIFLTIYFLGLFCLSAVGHRTLPLTAKIVANSYLLLSGIGYVWIIRVFLLIAFAAPVIRYLSEGTPSHIKYFLILGAIYIVYEVALVWAKPMYQDTVVGDFIEYTIFCLIPYGVIAAIGLRLPQLNRIGVFSIAMGSFVVFLIYMFVNWHEAGRFIGTQKSKYPPSAYYLSYALFVSCIAWLASEAAVKGIRKLALYKAVMFVAKNSIWIYLWHIPFIDMITLPFYLKYPVVFACASAGAFLQITFVERVLMPRIGRPSLQKDLRMILTG